MKEIENIIKIGSVTRCSDIDDYAELLAINGTKTSLFMDKYLMSFSQYVTLTDSHFLGSQKRFVDVSSVTYVPGEYHRYITVEPFVKSSAQLTDDLCRVRPNAQIIRVKNFRPFERDDVDNEILKRIEKTEEVVKILSSKGKL